jgi:NAD(P)-dependent dehydrogenase (short-subunit alcohol dehydrogenase family)
MGALDGKVAVITGGNSGIGLATAKRFVKEGAYVFITGRREAELDSAVSLIGKNVTAIQGDVSNFDADASATVAAVATQLGFPPVELGRLDKGGAPLHVLGGRPGGLLFQNLVKLG